MTHTQMIIMILAAAAATVLTRALAFIAFPEGKKTPEFIDYLGKVLPAAVFGMLVIYCFRNVHILTDTHALPELISAGAVVGLHVWKRQMLLSIAGGTICYMLLTQFVFV
ncbi:MAG: branched-chain amino acid transporter permease [Anaerovoracaceae bacterium]